MQPLCGAGRIDRETALANAANPAFPLEGGTVKPEGGATAAMQYITNYSGNIGLWLCVPVAVVLFAAVMGAWWLIFWKKIMHRNRR